MKKYIITLLVVVVLIIAGLFFGGENGLQILNNQIESNNEIEVVEITHQTYSDDNITFNYDLGLVVEMETAQDNISYTLESLEGDIGDQIKIYTNGIPENLNQDFFTNSMIINSKTFLYGEVEANNGVTYRQYMFQVGDTVVVIFPAKDQVDLYSIEII
jgi:hypothetical protein